VRDRDRAAVRSPHADAFESIRVDANRPSSDANRRETARETRVVASSSRRRRVEDVGEDVGERARADRASRVATVPRTRTDESTEKRDRER